MRPVFVTVFLHKNLQEGETCNEGECPSWSKWGAWSSWNECSRSCGGGHRKRDRVCVKKEGNKDNCFMDGPQGDKRYKQQEELCNPLPCPSKTFELN